MESNYGKVVSSVFGVGSLRRDLEVRAKEIERNKKSRRVHDKSVGSLAPQSKLLDVKKDLRRYVTEEGLGSVYAPAVSQTLQTLSELPQIKRKKNLYTVVIPSGSGKTYYSEKYNMLDVDACVPLGKRRYLARAMTLVADTTEATKQVAREWLDSLRSVIGSMTFDKPTILLVHDSLTGYIVGGSNLGVLDVKNCVKLEKLGRVGREKKELISLNENIVRKYSECDEYDTYEELETRLVKLANRVKANIAFGKVDAIPKDQVLEMSTQELVSAWREDLICYSTLHVVTRDNGTAEKVGTSNGINDWAVAMSNGDCSGSSVMSKSCYTLDLFKSKFKYEERKEVMRIMEKQINDNDKLIRILWWETVGIDMDNADMMLNVITNVRKKSPALMRGLGYKVAQSVEFMGRFVNQSEREKILQLTSCYGTVFFCEPKGDDDVSREYVNRYVRMSVSSRPGWIKKDMSEKLALFDCKVAENTPLKDFCKYMKNWRCSDVICLLEACKSVDLDTTGGSFYYKNILRNKRKEFDEYVESNSNTMLRRELDKDISKTIGIAEYAYCNGIDDLIRVVPEYKTKVQSNFRDFVELGKYLSTVKSDQIVRHMLSMDNDKLVAVDQ